MRDEVRRLGTLSDPRTVPQRFLIALAGIVTALGVVGGGVYAFAGRFGDPSQPKDGTPIVAGGRVEQGSPEADAFVRGLLAAGGQRRGSTRSSRRRQSFHREGLPSEGRIYSFLPLFYNCQGKLPGYDNCNSAKLMFGDVDPSVTVRSPLGVHFKGMYAIRITEGHNGGHCVRDQPPGRGPRRHRPSDQASLGRAGETALCAPNWTLELWQVLRTTLTSSSAQSGPRPGGEQYPGSRAGANWRWRGPHVSGEP